MDPTWSPSFAEERRGLVDPTTPFSGTFTAAMALQRRRTFKISFTELRFGLKLHTREHLQQVTCCDLFVFKAVFALKRSTSRQARTWNGNSEIRSVKE
jgi:hypothetical protein